MVSRIETKVGIRAQGLRPGVCYSFCRSSRTATLLKPLSFDVGR